MSTMRIASNKCPACGAYSNNYGLAVGLLAFSGFVPGIGCILAAFESNPTVDYEELLSEANSKLKSLQNELEQQQQIVLDCGKAIVGPTAEKRRFAKQRIRDIQKDIRAIKNEINSLKQNIR